MLGAPDQGKKIILSILSTEHKTLLDDQKFLISSQGEHRTRRETSFLIKSTICRDDRTEKSEGSHILSMPNLVDNCCPKIIRQRNEGRRLYIRKGKKSEGTETEKK